MLNKSYEYTRAIRFNLVGESVEKLYKMPVTSESTFYDELNSFLVKYWDLIKAFQNAFFIKNDDGIVVRETVEVRKEWLRNFARSDFYALDDAVRAGKSKFDVNLFENENNEVFYRWLSENNEILDKLNELNDAEQRKRRSDINFQVRRMLERQNISFIRGLAVENVLNDKENDECIGKLKQAFSKFEEKLDEISFLLAPDRENGIEVTRASFNYFAVNKAMTNFVSMDEKIKEQLNKPSLYKNYLPEKIRTDFVKEYGDVNTMSLSDYYRNLKKYQTDVVNKLSDKRIKQNYQKVYKDVANEVGEIKAQLAALQKEKQELRLLNYWVVILSENDHREFLLIPKEKMQGVKREMEKLPNASGDDLAISIFHSITLKAIEKLIRKNLSTEVPLLAGQELFKQIVDKKSGQIVIDKNTGLPRVDKKQIIGIDYTKTIDLYKKVLRGEFENPNNEENRSLVLQPEFDARYNQEIKKLCDEDFTGKTKEYFRQALEKITYQVMNKRVDEEFLTQLKNNCGCLQLKITDYDWERKNRASKDKSFTALYKDFWENVGTHQIKLNPEVRIFARPKREQNELKKQRNRFSQDSYKVVLTVTENAGEKSHQLSFVDIKQQTKMIETFNQEVVTNDFVKKHEAQNNLWYMGIDRGVAELATLYMGRWNQNENYDANGKLLPKPIPAPIEVYVVKDLEAKKKVKLAKNDGEKEVLIYKNPSYFMSDDEVATYFEKKTVSCIDLTTAKLIKGKIILNGDLCTYKNLKIARAKRSLFDKRERINVDAQIIFNKKERRFEINLEGFVKSFDDDYVGLPYWTEELDKVFSVDEVREDLQRYLIALKQSNFAEDNISIEQINHLRDAVAANMVGVIVDLFIKYPSLICLENGYGYEKNFNNNNEDIARRLEWRLYQKFQKYGLVPPRLKEVTLTQKDLSNLGIIHFVKKEGTSSNCPYCEQKSENFAENHNATGHDYNCSECGFDTKNNRKEPLVFIGNSDSVAAYNIAKRGCNSLTPATA